MFTAFISVPVKTILSFHVTKGLLLHSKRNTENKTKIIRITSFKILSTSMDGNLNKNRM